MPGQAAVEEEWFYLQEKSGFMGAGRSDDEVLTSIVDALLALSGVRVRFNSVRAERQGASYAIQAVGHVWANPAQSEGYWVVDGLLPVLACQTALLCRSTQVVLCSGCRRPISPAYFKREGVRRPPTGRPVYGPHDHCRHEAVLKTKRESWAHSQARRKAAFGDIHADSQTAG